jgi:cob(I)alamin adenosyltransferase
LRTIHSMPRPITPRIYTRTGDGGTTGILYGKRVRKDHPTIEANGAVDEAQAVIGVARAELERGSELDAVLVGIERDLWVLMAEIATAPEDRRKLEARTTLVTEEMVSALEARIDDLRERTEVQAEFVVPGENRVSALLDQARTVVRRAERRVLQIGASGSAHPTSGDAADPSPPADVSADPGLVATGSHVFAYLNRLSDLLWIAARFYESVHQLAKGDD